MRLLIITYANSNREPRNSVGREFLEPDRQHLPNILLSGCKEFSALFVRALGPTPKCLAVLGF